MNDVLQTPVTFAIAAFTVLISLLAFNNHDARGKLIFYPYNMNSADEYYRFVSHGFIHADYIHLFFNMYTFYSFGRFAEGVLFNHTQFLILYLTALVASSIFDFIRNKNNPRYAALGASGAVSAVLFSTIIISPWKSGVALFGVLPLPNIVFAVAYLWYCYYMDKKGNDNIGHSAHLWGSLYGFAFTGLIHPSLLANFFQQLLHPSF